MNPKLQIRDARADDMEPLTAIWNEVVTNSNAIYTEHLSSVEERTTWWQARLAQGYPLLIAEELNSPQGKNEILGFATFSDFRSFPGFRHTVEGSIHIHHTCRAQGLGTALFQVMVERARQLGKHILVAGVDSANTASLNFLARLGFQETGRMPEVGYKRGQYLELVFLQYFLTPSGTHPQP